jgi:hypothetical protein
MHKSLSCFVLMPFSKSFSFVYDLGIKPALKELEKELGKDIPIVIRRADDKLAVNDNKVHEIESLIDNHDLIVIDITGYNPNVLWELGYCQALRKHIIPLTQSSDDLPFNLRGLDVIEYEFSTRGLEELKSKFTHKLEGLVKVVQGHRTTLRFDLEISQLMHDIQGGLSRIRDDSILRNLAKNEIIRLRRRIKALTEGKFDLRNEKPNEEIIRYFCDYISQLDDEDCKFETITFYNFWNEITEEGKNWEYLNENIAAAERGAEIKRVFIVNGKDNARRIEDETFRRILTRLYEEAQEHKDKIELRVMFSSKYEEDCSAYGNFGIMQKGKERLLFRPEYSDDGRMRETQFYYYDERRPERSEFKANEERIRAYQARFRKALGKSEPLTEEHLK